MNKTLEKILEDELFDNEVFEGEGNLQIKNTSEGTKLPIILMGNTIQDEEPTLNNPVEIRNVNKINFKTCNVNLFNVGKPRSVNNNGINYIVNEDGSILVNGTATEFSNFEIAKNITLPAGTYTFKDIKVWTEETNWLDATNKEVVQTFNNTFIITTVCLQNNANYPVNNKMYFPMITIGDMKDNIKNKEEIISFPLTEGQVLFKEDCLADNGIHNNYIEFILDGETNKVHSTDTGTVGKNRFVCGTNQIVKVCDTSHSVAYCNKLKLLVRNGTYLPLEGFCINNNSVYIYIERLSDKSSDEANEFLKQNPLKFYIPFETPIVKPYTEAQQKAYDKICQATAYDDITNIICTDEIPCNFKVNAKISKIKKLEQIARKRSKL